MSGFYVHNKWLKVQREMFDGAPRELQQLSGTRWACRHIACCNVMDRLPAIVQVLEEIASENRPQRAVEARGILAQIDLNFAGSLVLFRKVLSDSKFLSDMLQWTSLGLLNLLKHLKRHWSKTKEAKTDNKGASGHCHPLHLGIACSSR